MSKWYPKTLTFDVSRLASVKQQSAVLSMFDGLASGQTFTVVCDFDPVRLKRQFAAFFDGEHRWTCLRRGPPEWWIEIGRTGAATGQC
jgi:uncharacterized protein (DUF2249 family)